MLVCASKPNFGIQALPNTIYEDVFISLALHCEYGKQLLLAIIHLFIYAFVCYRIVMLFFLLLLPCLIHSFIRRLQCGGVGDVIIVFMCETQKLVRSNYYVVVREHNNNYNGKIKRKLQKTKPNCEPQTARALLAPGSPFLASYF